MSTPSGKRRPGRALVRSPPRSRLCPPPAPPVPVEERGLVSCVSVLCSVPVDFCWMCLGDWKTHGSEYYECSRYKENPDIVNQSQQAQAREALKKYLFYFERVGVLSCTCFSRVGFFHLALLGETPSDRWPQRRVHTGIRAWSAGPARVLPPGAALGSPGTANREGPANLV